MIQLRVIDLEGEADYQMLCSWWDGHGWPAVPKWMLKTMGIIAEVNGKPSAAAFLYMINGVGICWLEWLVTDPKGNKVHNYMAIKNIIEFMSGRALEMDYTMMLTACRQPELVSIYERVGFTKTDEAVTHLVRVLKTNA